MTCTTAKAPPGYFRAVRAIWDLAEDTPGLPVPAVDRYSAVFHFTHIDDPADAREEVANAEAILSAALGVQFGAGRLSTKTGDYRVLSAVLRPSLLRIELIGWARHFDGQDTPVSVPELAAVAA